MDKSGRFPASCPVCGGVGFRSPRENLESTDVLSCESCGVKLSYAFLRHQTAQASSRAAEEAAMKPSNRNRAPKRKAPKAPKRKASKAPKRKRRR